MNAAAARPKTGFKFMLIVKGGPDQGISYQLLPPKVTIGRDPETNVTLSDPRVSRQAAVIEFSLERIVITDLSSRKNLTVDGAPTAKGELVDGSVIQIGDTQLVFAVEALVLGPQGVPLMPPRAAPSLHVVAQQNSNLNSPLHPPALGDVPHVPGPSPFANVAPTSHQQNYGPQPSRPRSNQQSQGGSFKILVAIVVIAGLYLWMSDDAKQKIRKGITTSTDIQKEIESSEKLQSTLKQKRKFASDEEKTRYEEANRHYQEGFRDYQNGQYVRALRSFETALAIDPANELARRYYTLAQKQRDDMVASLILEGRRYKDKQMYGRCSSALGKALDFMSNRDDLKYKQAEAMMKECDLLDEDRR